MYLLANTSDAHLSNLGREEFIEHLEHLARLLLLDDGDLDQRVLGCLEGYCERLRWRRSCKELLINEEEKVAEWKQDHGYT